MIALGLFCQTVVCDSQAVDPVRLVVDGIAV